MKPSAAVIAAVAAALSLPAWAETVFYRHVNPGPGTTRPSTSTDPATSEPPPPGIQGNTFRSFSVIGPSAPIEARVGRFAREAFSTSGAVGTPNWTASGLPQGLSFSNGSLSGIPTSAGTYPLVVHATDAVGSKAAREASVVVRSAMVVGVPSDVVVKVAEAFSAPAPPLTGAAGLPRWEVVGLLPGGVRVSPEDGRLYGTPSFAGEFPIQLRAYDATGERVDSRQFSLRVIGDLAVSGLSDATAHVGDRIAVPAPRFLSPPTGGVQWTQVKAPPGTAFGATGILSGQIDQPGVHEASVRASDASGAVTTLTYRVTAVPALSMAEAADRPVLSGVAFSIAPPQVSDAVGGVAYALTGDRPEGVHLDPATGRIEGVALTSGSRLLTLSATDSLGSRANRTFSLLVQPNMSFQPAADVAAPVNATVSFPPPAYRTAPGGTVSWAAVEPLPSGLSLQPSGTVTGSTALAGTHAIKLRATDSGSGVATVAYRFTAIPLGSLHTVPAPVAAHHVGTPFRAEAPAILSQATQPVRWQAVTLPEGASLASDGSVSGTVATAGSHSVVLQATDGADRKGTLSYTVDVVPPLAMAAPGPREADAGVFFAFAAPALDSAIAPVAWELSGTLPEGASFDPATGAIAGTAPSGGIAHLTLAATDASGARASRSFDLVVRPRLALGPTQDGVVRVGTPAAFPPPRFWTVPAGTVTWTAQSALPTGMSLAADGTVAGTPGVVGTYPVSLRATDSGSTSATASYRIVVSPDRELGFFAYADVTVRRGQALDLPAPTVLGTAKAPLTWSAVSVPAGTVLGADGRLTGSLPVPGTYKVTARAVDGDSAAGTASYVIKVQSDIALGAGGDRSALAGSAFSFEPPTVTSNIGKVTWSLAGTPPAGVSFDPGTGRLAGTLYSASSTSLTLTATDASGSSATRDVRLVVAGRLVFGPAPDVEGTVARHLSAQAPTPVTVPVGTVAWQSRSPLPAGMTLASDGTVSGTPSMVGTYPVSLLASDSGSNSAGVSYRIVVSPERRLAFLAYQDIVVRVGAAIEAPAPSLRAGAVAPVAWSAVSLPPGTSIDATGKLSGSLPETGTYDVRIRATDAQLATETASYKVVALPNFTIGTAADRAVDAGLPFAVEAPEQVSPYGAVTWALTGTLPDGTSFDTATGRIAGTAMAAGGYPLSISARDVSSQAPSRAFALTVRPRMLLEAASDVAGTVGKPMTVPAPAYRSAPGGTLTWTARTALPQGFSLLADGKVTGTPAAAGTLPVELLATDSGSVSQTVTYRIIAGPARQIATDPVAAVTVRTNAPLSIPAPAFRSPAPVGTVAWSPVAIPDGAALSGAGLLTGAVATPGTYQVTLRAIDSEYATGTVSFPLTAVAPLAIKAGPDLVADAGIDFRFESPGAENNIGTVYWSAEGLPPGVSIHPTQGYLTGRIPTAGTYAFTTRAVDQGGGDVTKRTVVLVRPRMAFASASNVTLRANNASATLPPPAYSSAPGGTVAWKATSTLPPGLALSGGSLVGVPSQVGTFPVSLEASDPESGRATVSYTVSVLGPLALTPIQPPVIRSDTYPSFAVASVTGTPVSPTWRLGTGSTLPPGLALQADGTLSGRTGSAALDVAGTYVASVEMVEPSVLNSVPLSTGNLTIRALSPLAMAAMPAARARVGTAYTEESPAAPAPTVLNEAVAPLTWSHPVPSNVAPGLSVSPTTGKLVGTPTVAGTYQVTVALTDGTKGAAQATYPVAVDEALKLEFDGFTWAELGETLSMPVRASNPAGAVRWTHSGTLPTGLVARDDGQPGIFGTIAPDAVTGRYVTTFTARDESNGMATASIEVYLRPRVPSGQSFLFRSGPDAPSLSTFDEGYAIASDASTANGPLQWDYHGVDRPPAGITLDYATGKLVGRATGTANASGTFLVVVKDGNGIGSAWSPVNYSVLAPPTLSAATVGGAAGLPLTRSVPTAMAAGNLSDAVWSVVGSPALPDGLQLAADGTLSGTAQSEGTTTVTVQATNRSGQVNTSATAKLTIDLTPAPILVSPSQAFVFQSGASAPTLTTATGGYALASDAGTRHGQVTWAVASGSLPSGISLDAGTGRFVGKATGTANSTASVAVTARDAYGTVSQAVPVTVSLVAPPTLSGRTVTAYLSTNANTQLASALSGGNLVGATWAVTGSTALPNGLSLSTGGVLSGTPQAQGTTNVAVTVTNTGASPQLSSTATMTVRVVPVPPSMPQSMDLVFQAGPSAPTLTTASTGYSVPVTATGSVTWSLSNTNPANLPAGITFDTPSGKFVGKATSTVDNLTENYVVARDSYGSEGYTRVYMRTVAPPILSAATATGATGTATTQSLPTLMNASNLEGATWAVSGSTPLPAGLALAANGTLSGTPTEANTTTVAVTVTNAGKTPSLSASANLTFAITGPAPTVQAGQVFNFPKGTTIAAGTAGYSVTTSVTGSKSFEVQSGTLPAGISFDAATGAFTGTSSATANASTAYSIRVKSAASGQFSAYQTVTLKVVAPPVLLSDKTASGNAGQTFSVDLPSLLTSGTSSANLATDATWSATGLPSGLSVTPAGILSGSTSSAGSVTATVSATNPDSRAPQTASVSLTVTVMAQSNQGKDNYPSDISAVTSTMGSPTTVPISSCYGQQSKSPGAKVPRNGYLVWTFAKETSITDAEFASANTNGWPGGYLPQYRSVEWWNASTGQWVNNWSTNASPVTSNKFRTKNEYTGSTTSSLGVCRLGSGGAYPPSLN